MEPQHLSIRSLGLKYGIIATIGFIVVFLIARAADINSPLFRFVNYIILAVCIGLALNEATKIIHKHRINYLPGLGIGLWTAFTTALLYALFMFIYSKMLNPDFVEQVRPYLPFQDYVNAGMLSFVAFGETLVFGAIFSFVMMQFFKRNRAPEAEAYEEAAERNGEKGGNNANVQ